VDPHDRGASRTGIQPTKPWPAADHGQARVETGTSLGVGKRGIVPPGTIRASRMALFPVSPPRSTQVVHPQQSASPCAGPEVGSLVSASSKGGVWRTS
jgi:hypothetical protein